MIYKKLYKSYDASMNIDQFQLTTKTHGLILRPHRESDAPFMFHLNSDPEVTKFTGDGALASVDKAVQMIQSLRSQFEEKQMGRFIVINPLTEKPMGWCGLKYLEDLKEVDLGYRFLKEHWGHGYASDTSHTCLQYGFKQLQLKRIIATVIPQNIGSVKVLTKMGLKKVAVVIDGGEECDRYEITLEDYLKQTTGA